MRYVVPSRLALFLTAIGMLSTCAPEPPPGTFAHLDSDFLLATSEPDFATTNPIRLRYEDDWVPRTCEGATYLSPEDHVIIEWRCYFATSPTTTAGALSFITGGLSDDDGDGVYTGTLVGSPLGTDDMVAAVPMPAEFTMTPCAASGGDGPCM